MKHSLVPVLALTIIAGAFSGCVADEKTPADTGPAPAIPADPVSDFSNLTLPDGESARAFIENYIMTHPFRMGGERTATFMDAARDDLEAQLKEFGLRVERQDYGSGVNILGIHPGVENPDQWVVLSAHYDTAGTTVYGGWDDGAGVAVLLELARTVPSGKFPFTIVFAFFDEEERGLIGSQNFVQLIGKAEETELLANLNTDPPGLNWPCGDATGPFPVKIIHELDKAKTEPRYQWLYEAVEYGLNASKVPKEVRDYTPGIPIATLGGTGVRGTSDHFNFGQAGIANVYLGGTPTTTVGPAAALTYALHTPIDTLQQMEARCTGGDGTLADGLGTIATTITQALVHMATTGAPDA